MPLDPDQNHKKEVHTNTLIAEARRKFAKCIWFPRKVLGPSTGYTLDYEELENSVQVHNRLCNKWINVAKHAGRAKRIQFSQTHWCGLSPSCSGRTNTSRTPIYKLSEAPLVPGWN